MSTRHRSGPSGEALRVRGGASSEDVAAIVEALHYLTLRQQPMGYERWRIGRLAALRVRPAR